MASELMIDREALLAELRQVFDARTAEVLLGVLDRVVAQVRAAGVTREDFSELKQIVRELAEAQRRTEQRVEELAEAQRQTEQRIEELIQTVQRLTEGQQRIWDKLGGLEGRMLEQDYREKAPAYFGRLLRKARLIPRDSLEAALEAHLSVEELHDVLLTDVIVSGQPRQRPEMGEVWLALEVSVVVDETDVTRAGRRADLLRRAGYRAIPVVAGTNITREAELEVQRQRVLVLRDGRELFWEEALAQWGA